MNENRVLCVMAHPDDAEIWCGGALVSNNQIGTSRILVERVSKERELEARLGAEELGCQIRTSEVVDEIICQNEITEFMPHAIITHNIQDLHPDHRRISASVLGAIFDARIKTGCPKRLYFCDSYTSSLLNGNVRGDCIVPIDSHFDRKVSALEKHKSQPVQNFRELMERQAAFWGLRVGCRYAEAFDRVSVMGQIPPHETM